MMSPSHYLAILVYLPLSTAIIGHENLNASCVQFDESKLADVLHLIREPAINTVEIILTVASANRTRVFPEMKWPWANEIGRTLISLTSRAKASVFSSMIFTYFLEVGMERVSIEVTEKIIGCLPPGKNGSDRVFSYLMEKLFLHIAEEENKDNYYKLCRPHDIEGPVQFNCCRIIGDSKLTICADYSSIVLDFSVGVLIAVLIIFSPLTLPLLLKHIITYPDTTFYKTSDSHMSLIFIVSMVLCEGDGLAKSFFRRLFFVGLTSLVFYQANFFNCKYFLDVYIAWAPLFCFFELLKQCLKQCECCEEKMTQKTDLNVKENLISSFTIPFSLSFGFYKNIVSEDQSSSCDNCCRDFCAYIVLGFSLLIISPVALGFCVIKFVIFDFILYFIFPYNWQCNRSLFVNVVEAVMGILTLAAIVILTGSFLIIFLSLSVGLILNGEFFNPWFAPTVTLTVYFWINWRSSVEAPCLELKTSTIGVCKEKARMNAVGTNDEIPETQKTANINSCCDLWKPFWKHVCSCSYICRSSDDNNNRENGSNHGNNEAEKQILVIKFDKNGEAMISKKLYEEVSGRILPLNDLLFDFFRRVVFVLIYAGIMLIVLKLGKESGVSGSLQAISAIVAILIPFIFDNIYGDHHLAQRKSNNMARKEKLKHIIWRVNKREKNVIVVKLRNSTTNVERLLQSLEPSWKTIKESLELNEQSRPKIKRSWQNIEQSWKAITQTWQTIENLWPTIESPSTNEQSWRKIEQLWKKIAGSREKAETSWQKIKKSEQTIEQSEETIEQIWQTIKNSWSTIEKLWQEIEQWLQKSSRTIDLLQDVKEQSSRRVELSDQECKQLSQTIKLLQQEIEQSLETIKQSWEKIKQASETITETSRTIVSLWLPTNEQPPSRRTIDELREYIAGSRRKTEDLLESFESWEMWSKQSEETIEQLWQAIKETWLNIKSLLQEIKQWLPKKSQIIEHSQQEPSERIKRLKQAIIKSSQTVTLSQREIDQSLHTIELSQQGMRTIKLLQKEGEQLLQTIEKNKRIIKESLRTLDQWSRPSNNSDQRNINPSEDVEMRAR